MAVDLGVRNDWAFGADFRESFFSCFAVALLCLASFILLGAFG
jgi:hypothetical protein